MTLLDRLRLAGASALDFIADIAESAAPEVPVELSIVISHPGRTDDAIVVGSHELPQLFAILRDMVADPAGVEGGTIKEGKHIPDHPPHGTVQ